MTAKTLLDELNYWYAIECAITLGNTGKFGLCTFVTSFLPWGQMGGVAPRRSNPSAANGE